LILPFIKEHEIAISCPSSPILAPDPTE